MIVLISFAPSIGCYVLIDHGVIGQHRLQFMIINRLVSTVIFTTLPLLYLRAGGIAGLDKIGVHFNQLNTLWTTSLPACLIILAVLLLSHKFGILPAQIRATRLPDGCAIWDVGSWILYVLAYEFIFRGFLLFISLELLPRQQAVLMNVFLYGILHFHKGITEVMLSLPFGLILCMMTLHTGSIWCAFLIHSTLAVTMNLLIHNQHAINN